MSNTAALRVGRLLEVRVDDGYQTAAEVDAIFAAIGSEMAKLPAETKVVTVVDWRRCRVMDSAAAQRMIERMAGNNPRVERSAALAAESKQMAVLQFMRLVRESALPDRKLFTQAQPLIAWLDEVLDEAEQERLRDFIAWRP